MRGEKKVRRENKTRRKKARMKMKENEGINIRK